MPRINPVNITASNKETAEILEAVRKKMGTVPNLISTMANSPAVAKAYLGFSQALASGALPPRLREQLALVVGETNSCGYCVAAHTALGKGVGLSEPETCDARRAVSGNSKEQAALEFARKVVQQRGVIGDSEVETLLQAGYTDGEICEIVAHVAMNIFTNYFNHIAGTEVDFPSASKLAA
jgi:uncharacterized peroxidase-related enzyme